MVLLLGGCKGEPDAPSNIDVSGASSAQSSSDAASGVMSSVSGVSSKPSSVKASSAASASSKESESSGNITEIVIGDSSEAPISSSKTYEPPVSAPSSEAESSSSALQSSSAASSAIVSSSTTTTQTTSGLNSTSSQTPPEVPDTPTDPIQARIAQMSLREKVYQMFFVTPEQLGGIYPVTSPMDISERPVGGILCMGANLDTVSQTREMLSKTQENAMRNGIGVFLAVDEEGGRVARCANGLGTTAFDGMAAYGARNGASCSCVSAAGCCGS